MFKSNSLLVCSAALFLFVTFSCDTRSPEKESNQDNENTIVTNTIVVHDTVFVSKDELDSLLEDEIPCTFVHANKMNILYKGVENPVSIEVSGVDDEDLIVTISNGSISRSTSEGYTVNVKSGTKSTIFVSRIKDDGQVKHVGDYVFRVKSVPNPTPFFAGRGVGDDKVQKRSLTAAQGVAARVENFEYDVKFTVRSFKLTAIIGGTPIEKVAKGNRVTNEMKTLLKKVRPGAKVYIENIKAQGPDGTIRNLGSLAFKVI